MRRWCFSPIVGDGGSGGFLSGYHVAVDDVPDTFSNAVIPPDPNTGVPLYTFAFCNVYTRNILQLMQVSNSYLFPDSSLDHPMSSIGTDPINDTESSLFAMRQACEARGLSVDFWLQHPTKPWGDWTYRQVLLGIVHQHDPTKQTMEEILAKVPE